MPFFNFFPVGPVLSIVIHTKGAGYCGIYVRMPGAAALSCQYPPLEGLFFRP